MQPLQPVINAELPGVFLLFYHHKISGPETGAQLGNTALASAGLLCLLPTLRWISAGDMAT